MLLCGAEQLVVGRVRSDPVEELADLPLPAVEIGAQHGDHEVVGRRVAYGLGVADRCSGPCEFGRREGFHPTSHHQLFAGSDSKDKSGALVCNWRSLSCRHSLCMAAIRTARERACTELTGEITRAACSQLAAHGAAGLSLRAVARELGMVSSALYRYFPSRDELLTALILDAYGSLADAGVAAQTRVARSDHRRRWLVNCRAVRRWAIANPHEYALIYGSPAPGYLAPRETVEPAARVMLLFPDVVRDAVVAGRCRPSRRGGPVDVAAGGPVAFGDN